MTKTHFFSAILLFYSLLISAQERVIDTVFIFDNQLNNSRKFQVISKLNKEDLLKNTSNLSEVLRFQSPVYIKENGRGMVSSPSFRGTTAQQTAFIWNGININSAFLGQGDLNNIAFLTADELNIKSGGGSVIYGSGAIGGSIHLNNELKYNQGFSSSLFSEAGSFKTYNNILKIAFSNDKLTAKFSGSYSNSENNYEAEKENGSVYINRNGMYYNTNFNFAAGYKIAPHHKISWISEFFNGTQHYPIFSEFQNKTKYETQNIRSMMSWDWNQNVFQNAFKAAYTEENFGYLGDIAKPKTSGGTGKNIIIKNDFNYFFNPKWNLNFIAEFQNNKGEGYQSGIDTAERNAFSVAGLLRYFDTKKFRFEAGVKKDFVQGISSPILFSFNGKWIVANWYELGLNFSRNFRFPSYNDLYWKPGGNTDLKSETSYQTELRNDFKIADFRISIVPYYIKIEDMIRWLPTSLGYWSAFNTNKVESYGLESSLEFQKKFGNHALKSIMGYSYTKSVNLETKKQLMYVPFHKIFGNINYQYNFFTIYVQGIFNGLTYTDSYEKLSEALKPYFVMNAGLSFTVFKHYGIGFKANNIFDEYYETTAFYPMPKRNYSMNFNINF